MSLVWAVAVTLGAVAVAGPRSSLSAAFAGMSTKLGSPGPRKALVVVGSLVFVGTAVWIATFPVSLSV